MSSTWDERHRESRGRDADSDPFLIEAVDFCRPLLPSGARALDVACGAGRHAVALAEAGFAVAAVDLSEEALKQTGARAAAAGVEIETRRADLESPDCDLGVEAYDLIAVFQFLHRPLFPALKRAARPGGLIVYKTFTTDQLNFEGGPRRAEHLLEPNELARAFGEFRLLRYEERCVGTGWAALIARKPD